MSLNLGVMSAAVTLDDAEYRKKLSGLENASGNSFRRIGQLAAGYLSARALFGFVSGAMSEFSKLEEGNNKLKYTYTGLREEAARTADAIVRTYGLARSTATNAIADIGDLLTGMGFSQGDALGFADQITRRGIDIASFKGLDQTEVIRKMTVALTGETESLKTMGVIVRQGSEEFRRQVAAVMEVKGATESQAKAQAILNEIMKQTANAAGDYLRPDAPRTYQQEITDLTEAVKQFKAEIGSQIQPVTQDAIVKARELLAWYNRLTPSAKKLANSMTVLSASIAVLTGTKFGRSILSAGKSASADEIEAQKTKAAEAVKRAEREKTDAVYAALAARQKMRLAEGEKAEAEAALNIIKLEKAKAQAKGDTAAVAQAAAAEAKAQMAVTEAAIKARNAENEYFAARQKMVAASENYRAASAALPGVLSSISTASTLAGTASLFFSGGLKAAALGVKTFFASLGPVGWTLIGLALAYEGVTAAVSIYNSRLEEQAKKSREAADAAAMQADEHKKEAQAMGEQMETLQKLQKYESLNDAERELAKQSLDALGLAYDENGKSIDEMLSRQGEEKKSLAELIQLRKEEIKQRRLADIRKQINLTGEAIVKSTSREEQTELFKRRQKLAEEYRMEVSGLGEKENEKNAIKEISQKTREEMDKLSGREFEIKFRLASPDEQIKMLQDKLDSAFSEYRRTGKFDTVDEFKAADRAKMTEKELKDLQKIIDLEEKRDEIRRKSAESIQKEQESYLKFEQERSRRQSESAIERELRNAEQSGDGERADSIMQREYKKAQEAARNMTIAYREAFYEAQQDGVLTDAERTRIDERRREMERALSDQDKWGNRIADNENRQQNAGRTIGAFSTEILNAILGGDRKPELETAKNTSEMVRLQKQLLDKSGAYTD